MFWSYLALCLYTCFTRLNVKVQLRVPFFQFSSSCILVFSSDRMKLLSFNSIPMMEDRSLLSGKFKFQALCFAFLLVIFKYFCIRIPLFRNEDILGILWSNVDASIVAYFDLSYLHTNGNMWNIRNITYNFLIRIYVIIIKQKLIFGVIRSLI